MEIGPTEREALRGGLMQPYTLLRNTTLIYNNKPATCDVIITSLTYSGDKDDGWRAMSQAKRKIEYEAQMGKKERGLQVG